MSVSDAQLAANRENAKKSTGPRTSAGKARSSRNATTHGFCALQNVQINPCVMGEDTQLYPDLRRELLRSLNPRSAMQRLLVEQIINLQWRLMRVMQAQVEIFDYEAQKTTGDYPAGQHIPPAQILADRFSDDSCNGFILLSRYERSIRVALHKSIEAYDRHVQSRANVSLDDDLEPQPAWNAPASADEPQRNPPASPGTIAPAPAPAPAPEPIPDAPVETNTANNAASKTESDLTKRTQFPLAQKNADRTNRMPSASPRTPLAGET